MMPSTEEHHKIPNREAAVTPVRGLRKQQRVRNLAMKRRQKKQDKQDIPNEDAAVMPAVELRKQHRVRYLAAESRWKMRDRTRGNHGSRRKSAVARRKVSRHARVAWRKRKLIQRMGTQENCGPRKELSAAGVRKIPEGNNGIRHRDVKEPPHLRKKRTNGIKGWSAGQRSYLGRGGMLRMNLYKIFRGILVKQIVGTPSSNTSQ
jgi:hypothetical protein